MQTQTIRNGQSIRLQIPPGESIAVVAVSGTYNASIVEGAGLGVIATNATGATYGPYNSAGTFILLTSSASSEIDFAIAVTPVIVSDTIVLATINPATGTQSWNMGATPAALVGFHGVAGTPQASAYTQTYSTADKTHAALTATAISAADAVPAAAATAGAIAAADIVAIAAATTTLIAAADAAAAAAATATALAAVIPAAAPAGGTGAAAGAYDTAANRDAAIATINDLRTWAVEVDLDYEALLVDVADIRTKYGAAVTLANELKADFNLNVADVADIRTKYAANVTLTNELKLDYTALLVDVADIRTKYAAAVTLTNEQKVDYTALLADVTDVKQLCNSIIDDLQAKGLVG